MSDRHPIQEYLTASGLTQAEFARRIGTTPGKVCDVLKGRVARFSPEIARSIVEQTGGAFSLEWLLFGVGDAPSFKSAAKKSHSRGGRQ